jgi:hypothetical protein
MPRRLLNTRPFASLGVLLRSREQWLYEMSTQLYPADVDKRCGLAQMPPERGQPGGESSETSVAFAVYYG